MASAGSPTYYDVLQVLPTAEQEIVEAAYRRLAQRYHPDVSDDPDAAERMKQLNAAYQVLRDPRRRAEYDALLEAQRRPRLGTLTRPSDSLSMPRPAPSAPPRPLLVAGLGLLGLVALLALLWPAEAAPWQRSAARASDPARPAPTASPTPRQSPTSPALMLGLPSATLRPAPTPTRPTARLAWPEAEREVDLAWERDWPRAIELLEEFRAQYPNHTPSRDRYYAALLGYGRALLEQGRLTEGVEQLEQAESLRPNQGEATALLLALTPIPSATPSPTDRWALTLQQIEPFWGRDWLRVIGPVEAFVVEYPDYTPAVEKLYAALVFYGQELLEQGLEADGLRVLEQARDLMPERAEAVAALEALTPTPQPAQPQQPVAPQRPAVRQPPIAPPRVPAAPPIPLPTATKVPFPGRGR